MKQRIEQIKKQFKRWRQRLRNVNYKNLAKLIGTILTAVPGIAAWLLEVVALCVAIGLVYQSAVVAYEDRLWQALGLATLSALMIALTILTSYYTQPSDSKHGGGG